MSPPAKDCSTADAEVYEVRQVEIHNLGGVAELSSRLLQCTAVATGQDHPLQPSRQLPHDRQTDLGGAADKEHGLRLTQGIDHRPSLSDRSLRHRRRGSTSSRTRRNSGSWGYITGTCSGRMRESFAK